MIQQKPYTSLIFLFQCSRNILPTQLPSPSSATSHWHCLFSSHTVLLGAVQSLFSVHSKRKAEFLQRKVIYLTIYNYKSSTTKSLFQMSDRQCMNSIWHRQFSENFTYIGRSSHKNNEYLSNFWLGHLYSKFQNSFLLISSVLVTYAKNW